MRILRPMQILTAGAAIAVLAGCSGGSAIAPNSASPKTGAPFLVGRVSDVLSPIGQLKIDSAGAYHFMNRYSCPATGLIAYMSDEYHWVINIYAGKFNGQSPCGRIGSVANGTAGGIRHPAGLYVHQRPTISTLRPLAAIIS